MVRGNNDIAIVQQCTVAQAIEQQSYLKIKICNEFIVVLPESLQSLDVVTAVSQLVARLERYSYIVRFVDIQKISRWRIRFMRWKVE